MAELVDARDLKCPGVADFAGFFCKPHPRNHTKTYGTKRDLQTNLVVLHLWTTPEGMEG